MGLVKSVRTDRLETENKKDMNRGLLKNIRMDRLVKNMTGTED